MKKSDIFLKRIEAEINAELDLTAKLMDEYQDFLEKYSGHMDSYLLRVKASYMTDFYMGAEKVFRIIAEELNGGTPKGEEGWHKKLLSTMTI